MFLSELVYFAFFFSGGLIAKSAAMLFSPSGENALARTTTPAANFSGFAYVGDAAVGNEPSIVYRTITSFRSCVIVTAAIVADKLFISIFGAGHDTRAIANEV